MAAIIERLFGVTKDGEPVTEYTLKNADGMTVRVLDYGATVRSILVPDRNGNPVDVALGYDDLSGYEEGSCFFGATVGRVANRIAGASFPLDGRTVCLEPNEGPNHLHGVFSRRVFKRIDESEGTGQPLRDPVSAGSPKDPENTKTDGEMPRDPVSAGSPKGPESPEAATLLLCYISPDGEEGYPGTLCLTVRYTLTEDNALRIDCRAETDAPTAVNLTNHTYFNLNGEGDILGHTLRIDADAFCEIGADMIPTGRILPVDSTPMDFRTPKRIGRDIAFLFDHASETEDVNDPGNDVSAENANDPGNDTTEKKNLYRTQVRLAHGYDHSYVLSNGDGLRLFAEARGDRSGIRLEAFTTEPAVQLYTGNFVDTDTAVSHATTDGNAPSADPWKGGVCYPRFGGFALEAQHHPDAPHHPDFPSIVLRPGETYRTATVYRFPNPAE